MWGVHCVRTGKFRYFRDVVGEAIRIAREQELATAGDCLVITAGVPLGVPGSTNNLHIARVE